MFCSQRDVAAPTTHLNAPLQRQEGGKKKEMKGCKDANRRGVRKQEADQ